MLTDAVMAKVISRDVELLLHYLALCFVRILRRPGPRVSSGAARVPGLECLPVPGPSARRIKARI
jgi:hypothetical protein